MSDIADNAENEQAAILECAMSRRVKALKPFGACYQCTSPVPAGRTFCEGGECEEDYLMRMKMEKIAGKA